MSKSIYDKLNLINQETDKIKTMLVNSKQLTAEEATLENLPPAIQAIIEAGGGSVEANPYEELYMQRTANETSMVGLFSYTPALTTLDLSKINTSKVTDMSYMFSYCNAPYLDLSGFDTSNVTNMANMFYYCTSEINIDGWDTSKLTNANYMFSYFTNKNKYIDLSVLDFSNVTSATDMFYECNIDYVDIRNINIDLTKLPQTSYSGIGLLDHVKGTTLDLSNWILDSSMTDIKEFFSWCGCKEIDLTNWKTTNITNMEEVFYYNSSLERLIMPDWDMTNVTKTSSFFYKCDKLNYIDLSRSNDVTIAKIATLVPAKTLAAYGQILIPVDSSQANIEALAAKYWKPVGPRIDMISCEIDPELNEIKPGKSTKLYYNNPEPWYGNDIGVEYVSSDETIATIDKETMTITSTGIEGTTEITARIADTQEVISEQFVFSVSETDNYPNVIKFRGTSTPGSNNYIRVNGTNVRLSAMNYNRVSGIYTYDVGAPITSIQFNGYNNYAYSNTCTDVVKINTSNITNMEYMFYYCDKITSLDLSNCDTSKVTNMKDVFAACFSLTSLDLSSFNTSQVTTMQNMFSNCKSLTSLNLSNFDTSKVTIMATMLQGCNKLHTLRLDNCSNDTINKIITSSGFPTGTIDGATRKIYCRKENTDGLTIPTNWVFIDCVTEESFIPKEPGINGYVQGQFQGNENLTEVNTVVTSSHTDLSYMFYDCYNLRSVNTQDWDVSNVCNMNNMFDSCGVLYTLDLSNWSPNAVYDMSYMFKGCSNLNSLNIGYWYLSSAQNMNNMFADCSSLYSLDLSGFSGTYNLQDTSYMFYNCSNLSELYLNNFDMSQVYSTDYMFSGCSNLTYLHLEYCSYDTVDKIINSTDFPVDNYGTIYCSFDVYNNLTPPGNWTFEAV